MNADSHKKLFHLLVHRPRAAEALAEAQAEREGGIKKPGSKTGLCFYLHFKYLFAGRGICLILNFFSTSRFFVCILFI